MISSEGTRKVIFCVPSLNGPTAPFMDALEQSIPPIVEAGWNEGCVEERGNPYISAARSIMLRKALDAKADVIVFLDYDLSWKPRDLLTLIETPGDVVAGVYRFKKPEEEYMGALIDGADHRPIVRGDGCIKADRVPGGFLKITAGAVDRFMRAYPDLIYGKAYNPSIDLFNHGAHKGVWYGEDYAFSRRWVETGGDLWIVPDLDVTHHSATEAFPGNFHQFMMRQPGGSLAGASPPPESIHLTRRQAQVVEGVRRGKQSKVIARDLNISVGTVKVHLSRVMKKMKAANRTEVAVSTLLRG